MNDDLTAGGKATGKLVKFAIIGVILLLVFLIGLVPMWLQKRDVAANLVTVEKQLHKTEIKGMLLQSIVEAKRGEYEAARQGASDFFTKLNAEIEKGEEGALTETEREKLKTVFANRDALITMLAQRDQASTERLTDIYVDYQNAMGVATKATAPAQSAPPSNAAPETTVPQQ